MSAMRLGEGMHVKGMSRRETTMLCALGVSALALGLAGCGGGGAVTESAQAYYDGQGADVEVKSCKNTGLFDSGHEVWACQFGDEGDGSIAGALYGSCVLVDGEEVVGGVTSAPRISEVGQACF